MATFMNTVPRRTPNPTATVVVNGLALLCFSRLNQGRAEVGFLDVPDHPLFITIYDSESGCNIVRNNGEDFSYPIQGGEIKINLNNSGLGSLCHSNDDQDFRWMLNLDEIHLNLNTNPRRIPIKSAANFFAKLFIKNGEFFTEPEALSSQSAKIKREDNGHLIIDRRVGKAFGVDIHNDSIVVELDNPRKTITLNRTSQPYIISIRHKCARGSTTLNDFTRFYDVLDRTNTGHPKTKLVYENPEPAHIPRCEHLCVQRFDNDEKFRESAEKNKSMLELVDNIRRATEACQSSTKDECPENLSGQTEPC